MKSNQVIKTTINDDGTVRFDVRGVDVPIEFDLTKVHPDMVKRAALHGFIQRISDGAAMGRDPLTGESASPEQKADNMRRIANHYMAGGNEWNMARAGGGGAVSYLAQAIAQYRKIELERAREFVKGLDAKTKRALEMSNELRPIIDGMRKAAVGNVDTESLLADL